MSMVGEESPRPRELGTGLPSGPSMLPPSGEFIIPGSRLPMEPRPESGPGPMELGVEHGVDTWVSCCDICAIEEIGSKPLPPPPPTRTGGPPALAEVGVPGFNGMLSCGVRPPPGGPPIAIGLGDMPGPGGNRPPPGLLGIPPGGKRGLFWPSTGPGEGAGKARDLSCELGVWGVPGIGPGVWSPEYMLSLVGVWGVCGPPGYLGG